MSESEPASTQGSLGFRHHLGRTMYLGLPLIGSQLAQMSIGVTDTVMVGWLGAEPLAGMVLGAQLFFITFIFGAGITHAIVPIAANAMGRGDQTAVRRGIRMGMWGVAIYAVIALSIMAMIKPIYSALGQEPANIAIGAEYLSIAMWGVVPALLVMAYRSFLTVLEQARIILIATGSSALLNVLLDYMLIFGKFGAPKLGVAGAAWASLGTNMLALLILLVYLNLNPRIRKLDIFSNLWRPDWGIFLEMLKLGIPISIGIIAEVGMFIAAAVTMGIIGTIPLAAHGIAIQIASVTFMIPLGLSNAASVRVGKFYGMGDSKNLTSAAYAVIVVGLGFATATALILLLFAQPLVLAFLDMSNADAKEVFAYAIPLMYVAAGFQLVDALQIVLVGILRGMKDTNIPMRYGIFGYWLCAVPIAWFLAFKVDMGGLGLWIGLAIGLAIAAAILFWRFSARYTNGIMDGAG